MKYKITRESFQEIEDLLKRLYDKKRTQIVEELRDAYEFGDLRENSEFDAARDAERNCDIQIKRIENLLRNMEVIDEAESQTVHIGSSVTVLYVDEQEKETYKIVSPLEVSKSINNVSNESPMGKALYGAKLDDIVEVTSPSGTYKVRIINIF